MKCKVIPTTWDPCSCESEGYVDVYLPKYDLNLRCEYFADSRIVKEFPIGTECSAELYVNDVSAFGTDKRSCFVTSTSLVGKYIGQSKDECNDDIYLVDSLFEVKLYKDDWKQGKVPDPGSWVEVSADPIFGIWFD